MLQHWQSRRWPRNVTAGRRRNALRRWQSRRWPRNAVAERRWNASQRWWSQHWLYAEDGYDDGDYAEAGEYAKDEYDDNDYNKSLTNIVEYDVDNDVVARQIEAYAAPFFARVDTIMAEIRAMDDCIGVWAAFGDELLAKEDNEASALTMPPSTPPMAVSSPPHYPTSYVDAVLSTMGGSSQATSLTFAPVALPSPAIDGQLRMDWFSS